MLSFNRDLVIKYYVWFAFLFVKTVVYRRCNVHLFILSFEIKVCLLLKCCDNVDLKPKVCRIFCDVERVFVNLRPIFSSEHINFVPGSFLYWYILVLVMNSF